MIDQDKVETLKGALIEACDKHLADGGKIRAGTFVGVFWGEPGMCPIGCLSGGSDYFGKVAVILGGTEESYSDDIWDFVNAFDGHEVYSSRDPNGPLAVLGRELRAKYITEE